MFDILSATAHGNGHTSAPAVVGDIPRCLGANRTQNLVLAQVKPAQTAIKYIVNKLHALIVFDCLAAYWRGLLQW